METEAKKFDSGKPPLSLIPRRANEEEAKVLDFGRQKYGAWNWAKGMDWSRLVDAGMRHMTAFADGEDVDPESGLSHLAHARACLGFLLDYEKEHPELDDRRKRVNRGGILCHKMDITL
jgi:hypothetical protein